MLQIVELRRELSATKTKVAEKEAVSGKLQDRNVLLSRRLRDIQSTMSSLQDAVGCLEAEVEAERHPSRQAQVFFCLFVFV